MARFFILIVFIIRLGLVSAQSISPSAITSGSTAASDGTHYISGSIGETSIATRGAGNPKLTEGFLQPYIQKIVVIGPNNGCPHEELTLLASGSDSYVWVDINEPDDTLSTDSVLTITLDHVYELLVTAPSDTSLKANKYISVLTIQECPYDLVIYQYITPNGDGVNDKLIIENIEQSYNHDLKIFNRWGQLVYESQEYHNDWPPGNVKDGVYIYVLRDNVLDREHKGKIVIEQ